MSKRSSNSPARWGKPRDASLGTVVAILVICAVCVISVVTFQRYAFVDAFLFPLWYVALGVGILCGGLFVRWLMKGERSMGKRIGMFLLITILAGFTAGSLLAHANHLFDPSEPVRYTVMIEDKAYRAGGRGSDYREFTVTARGKTFDIRVPRKHYKTFEVGDFYVIEYREGALGEPYYLPAGGVSEGEE